jgi:hypothetical protein
MQLLTCVALLLLLLLLSDCCCCCQVEPELRGTVGDALAAYASISDKQLLGNLYRVTLQKYQKV